MTGDPLQNAAPGNRTRLCLGAVALGLALSGCASKEKKDTGPDYASLRWEQRINQQIRKPETIRSPFTKEVFNASQSVRTQDYKTQGFHGGRSFSGADDRFKAGTFPQADKTSRAGSRTFSGADDRSRLADGTFKTNDSRFNGAVNSNAGKTSSFADDLFKTGADPTGSKAISNSRRPLITEQEKPGYTEDEVRSILKKD